jgi:hypothetical protein
MNYVHVYEVKPRKRGVDLISDSLPIDRLLYGEPKAIGNAIDRGWDYYFFDEILRRTDSAFFQRTTPKIS